MKASALRILSDSERSSWTDAHAYAKGDQELWTVKLVKEALVDAFRMLRHSAGKVGPGDLRAWWPAFQNNPEDYVDGEKHAKERRSSEYHTRMTYTRMEMVLLGWKDSDGRSHEPWLRGPLSAAPELHEKLEAWALSELNGGTTKDLCERRRWSLATFKRHRDRAAGIIAHRLNVVGLAVF